MKTIYADHAATTPTLPEVAAAIADAIAQGYGNPSAAHALGRAGRETLEAAREETAALLGCHPDELIYTASGSEADNLAIKGMAAAALAQGRREILVSAMEHPAVRRAADSLSSLGFTVKEIAPREDGIVRSEDIAPAVTDRCALVAVMTANNEVGTIQPIREIAEIAHAHGALMLTDAVQAVGHMGIDFHALGADLLALSGHKFGAPAGIGALLVRRGVRLSPLVDGGGQERGLRSGTENIPYAVGMAKALSYAAEHRDGLLRVAKMRDRLIDLLLQIPGAQLNGARAPRLPGNANISFSGVGSDALVFALDRLGVCASAGAACHSGRLSPSPTLRAMGFSDERATSAVRFSLSHQNDEDDVERIASAVSASVSKIRSLL